MKCEAGHDLQFIKALQIDMDKSITPHPFTTADRIPSKNHVTPSCKDIVQNK